MSTPITITVSNAVQSGEVTLMVSQRIRTDWRFWAMNATPSASRTSAAHTRGGTAAIRLPNDRGRSAGVEAIAVSPPYQMLCLYYFEL